MSEENINAVNHTIWMLASAIQNLTCIKDSTNAAGWLEAAKGSIAKAAEHITKIEA